MIKKKKKVISIVIILTMALMLVFIVYLKNRKIESVEYYSDYSRIFGEFTAKTASELLKDKKENTCYSSVSLFATMSLISETTESDTQKQILSLLGMNSIDELEDYYKQMLGDIGEKTETSKIVLANSFWMAGNSLSNVTNEKVDSMIQALDCEMFLKEEISATEINSWVEEKTEGLIKNMLSAGDVPENMTFVNTLYYKSKWIAQVKEKSVEQAFYLENGNSVQTTFLNISKQNLEYFITDEYTCVLIPMEIGEVVLILPNEDVDLQSIISENDINNIMATSMDEEKKISGTVSLEFPKCDIEYSVSTENINEVLEKLGCSDLFNNAQWVNGIVGGDIQIIQNTRFMFNEEGIEGAAATAAVNYIARGASEEEPLNVIYNRPFMYILMQDEIPLFIGTVYNPAD